MYNPILCATAGSMDLSIIKIPVITCSCWVIRWVIRRATSAFQIADSISEPVRLVRTLTQSKHRREISAYTWMCHGQRATTEWLHNIGKEETPWCHCRQGQEQEREQPGRHIVEEYPKLTELRREVKKDEKEMVEWRTRHSRGERREKGDVGLEEEREKLEGERVEKLESFFDAVFPLLSDSKSFDATNFLQV